MAQLSSIHLFTSPLSFQLSNRLGIANDRILAMGVEIWTAFLHNRFGMPDHAVQGRMGIPSCGVDVYPLDCVARLVRSQIQKNKIAKMEPLCCRNPIPDPLHNNIVYDIPMGICFKPGAMGTRNDENDGSCRFDKLYRR